MPDVPLGWQWPDGEVRHFVDKCRQVLSRHERVSDLTRGALVYLSVCGWAGTPLDNLRGWVDLAARKERLRPFLLEFDDPDLRAWVESQVGWRTASLPAQRRSRLRWAGMRTK